MQNVVSGKRKDKYEKRSGKEIVLEKKPLCVCDTLLQGFGKYLRASGLDALLLGNGKDHSNLINICLREERVILTRGKLFLMLRGHGPEGMCMWVPDGTLREQLKRIITRYIIVLQSKQGCQH